MIISIYGILNKVNFEKAFDAYCDGHRIIIQKEGMDLEDGNGNGIALDEISKKIVRLRGEWGIFRFKRAIEEMKEKFKCGLDFYVAEKFNVAV